MLGQMLFNGDVLPRQPARGLMLLTLARDNAGPDEVWINEVYTERAAAGERGRTRHGRADAGALGAGRRD